MRDIIELFRIFHRIDRHMAHLQPIVMLDPESLLAFVLLTHHLPVRKGPDQFRSMPVVVEVADSIFDTIPSGWLLGLVVPDLVEMDLW